MLQNGTYYGRMSFTDMISLLHTLFSEDSLNGVSVSVSSREKGEVYVEFSSSKEGTRFLESEFDDGSLSAWSEMIKPSESPPFVGSWDRDRIARE